MAAFLNSARYVGDIHPSPEAYRRHIHHFRRQAIIPTYVFRYEGFDKYNIQIQKVINNLGWMNALPAYPQSYCPEPVRLFYSNLQVSQSNPLQLQTMVNDNYDLIEHGFNHISALQSHLAILPFENPVHISSKCLPDHMRVMHFLITRHFLPRSIARDELTPLDIWILYNACVTQHPISLPHLIIRAMQAAASTRFVGDLPFAGLITRMLDFLGIDISQQLRSYKIISLRPQSILRKIGSQKAPTKDLLDIAKGGEPPKYCCAAGEVGHKLELLIHSIGEFGSWEFDNKDLQEASLKNKIIRLLKILRQRGDWDFDNIEELDLGASDTAKETKRELLELVDKKNALENCSDYESDPEPDF
ncbi:hypothetical protein LINPERPRIM_LOCUS21287 [Linum perenne]